jgi:tetratricopeptide (TPR) repeat protein
MVDDNDFKNIAPADVDLTRPASGAAGDKPDTIGNGNRWLLPSLILALLAVAAVIFILPRYIQPDTTGPKAERTAPAPVKESPFREAQLAKARQNAQEVLAGVLEKQGFLEGKNVKEWGREDYERALSLAAEGDALYRKREFGPALDRYQAADQALAELENRIDREVATALERGQSALAAGDADRATEAFQHVLAIEPDKETARKGLERARVLPAVRSLIAGADSAREAGDWQRALELYREARQRDPANTEADEKLADLEQAILDRDFAGAMSRGFSALQAGRPEQAADAFRAALKLKSDSSEARDGLNQARNQLDQRWIRERLARARDLESREQWSGALDLYQQILDRESVMDARIGLIRSRARAELDAGLEKTLADPLRLGEPAVARHARQLLEDARSIENPGPRLARQKQALADALESSADPVPVTLHSDNKTRVTLLRVGKLGTFDTRRIALKPGRYVAVGTREGYRDVRVEFEVHSSEQTGVTIACREPV